MDQTTGSNRSGGDSILRSPVASVAVAFLAGVLFRLWPVSVLVGGIIRLAVGLSKPVLLVFGVMKAVELLRKSDHPR